MAIKAFCEKLMAITDGPSLMDHHRHVCREFNSVTFIFNFVVEPTLVEQNDVMSSTRVQLEVLNEIKRMQNSLIKQQTINVAAALPQEQGRVSLGLSI